ncbi:hypothetical protein L3081_05640 [Colwellia sp. MSW7]|uniref:Solute-binding protein family 3/N-terminal domain-containing protein n=1 Tax=Colwellia maritima TaxID=2912588 RepID=A0ABS9X0H4_9GAMM|nr:hypothetical protein [Colwellia maritima]MCI2282971.1 hypothetical protein [Colwellia maritima]
MKSIFFIRLVIVIVSFAIPNALAIDTIKLLKPFAENDKRSQHKNEVILKALEITETEFGPFHFEYVDINMTPSRALISLKEGQLINTYIGPDTQSWENSVITIKIPIRLGLLSYRLLLIHKSNLPLFASVNNKEALSELNAGLQYDWVTTTVFKENSMKFTTSHKFDSLFEMLKQTRFDYIPRAVYEIYDELNMRKSTLADIIIEPTLALHIPMATYVYVSPQETRLAKRIELGLHKLIANGDIKKILDKYYAKDISRANLKQRQIIHISNPSYNDKDIIKYKDVWREY